ALATRCKRHVGVTNRGNARDLPASRSERNTVSAATGVRGCDQITESSSFCCPHPWMSGTLFINGLGGDQCQSPRGRRLASSKSAIKCRVSSASLRQKQQ